MKLPKLVLMPVIILILVYIVISLFSLERKKTVLVDDKRFSVEIAKTQEQKNKGLSGRQNLCGDCAMLFPFEKEGRYIFWMKGMKFDIDIIWIKNGKIARIDRNVSHESSEEYSPRTNIDSVLEINAGLSDKYSFEEGNRVVIN